MKALFFAGAGRARLPAGLSRWLSRTLVLAAASLFLSLGVASAQQANEPDTAAERSIPLPRAHAHNDYLHPRPLLDALSRGFASVEADVHLVGQELLVAHDPEQVDSLRTLESLYLAPLREWVTANDGVVHEGAPPLVLLIDIKTDAEATYARLHPLLRRYADILTIFAGDRVVNGPVLAVISGNRPRSALLAAPVRFASFDGRIADLDRSGQLPPSFMPLVSDDWADISEWDGDGLPPAGLETRVRDIADATHAQGRRLRLWGTPDRPEAWAMLLEAGVDLINSDDLDGLRAFLLENADGSE